MNTKKFLENLKNERFESELDLLGYISDMIFDNPIVIMLEEIDRYKIRQEEDVLYLLQKDNKNYKVYIKSSLEEAYIYKVENCNNIELLTLRNKLDFYLINKYTQKKTIVNRLCKETVDNNNLLVIDERYSDYKVIALEVLKNYSFNNLKELFNKLILGIKSQNFNLYIKTNKYTIEDIKDEDEEDDEILYIYSYILYIDNITFEIEIYNLDDKYYIKTYREL